MTEGLAVLRRFQFSLRSLLIVTGILALLLVPVAWMARQREQVLRAHEAALRAVALELDYRAKLEKQQSASGRVIDRSGPSGSPRSISPAPLNATDHIERLERENAELRDTVEVLRREIERLKAR